MRMRVPIKKKVTLATGNQKSRVTRPSRYHLVACPAIAPGLPFREMKNSKIAVTKDNQGVGKALVDLLNSHHYSAELVENIPINSDYVICLEGINNINSFDEALSINKRIFKHAQALAKTTTNGKAFITVQDTGGYFGIKNNNTQRAWLGGISGLLKTAAKEWPDTICKVIDLEMANSTIEDAANKLLHELLAGGKDLEVGLPANEDRIAPQLISNIIQPRSSLNLADNMRILVTGGGYGITATCLIELARHVKLRIAICSRTILTDEPENLSQQFDKEQIKKILIESNKINNSKLTPVQIEDKINKIFTIRKIREIIATLQNLGSEVIYLPMDIQDLEQLKMGAEQMRNLWGGIDGFIHGAGIIADKYIKDKTDEQFDRVLTTKVTGLNNLLSITEQDQLKLICLFSSESAIAGNAGQSDYAMANEILNSVAQSEYITRKNNCLVKSINWGPWEIGMVNDSLKHKFINDGVMLLTEKEGSLQFAQELLSGDARQVVVLVGGGLAKPRNK